jgi:hypothetical protein
MEKAAPMMEISHIHDLCDEAQRISKHAMWLLLRGSLLYCLQQFTFQT